MNVINRYAVIAAMMAARVGRFIFGTASATPSTDAYRGTIHHSQAKKRRLARRRNQFSGRK